MDNARHYTLRKGTEAFPSISASAAYSVHRQLVIYGARRATADVDVLEDS